MIEINSINYDEIIKNIVSSLKESFKILLDRANFDRTFKAKVISKINENKYQILYKGQKHTVTSDSTLSINQIIKVCAPQNNWSELFVVNSNGSGESIPGSYVTGVKGENEQNYRSGNVNITKENLGINLNNYVPKTSISNTQVNDSNKIPSSSLIYSMNDTLTNDINQLDRIFFVEDTRKDNQPPSWYYKNYNGRTYVEFKLASALGFSDSGFGVLFTITGWSDSSGNTPNQMLLYKNKIAIRYALSNDTWSEWNKVIDKIDQNATSILSAVQKSNENAGAIATLNNNIGKVFYGTELTKEISNRWIDNITISLDVGVYIVEGQINISKQGASVTAKLISPSSELGRQSVYSQDNNIYSATITKTVVITTKSNIVLQSWSNNGTQAVYVALKATKIK